MPRTATGTKKSKSATTTAKKTKSTTGRKTQPERRRAQRGKLKLLTAYRCLDGETAGLTGFARALNLSEIGTLLESPDPFGVGQKLSLEFLMDNNRILQVDGQVTRVTKHKVFYHVAVDFGTLPASTRRLLMQQAGL